jgi:hypothetical protein
MNMINHRNNDNTNSRKNNLDISVRADLSVLSSKLTDNKLIIAGISPLKQCVTLM